MIYRYARRYDKLHTKAVDKRGIQLEGFQYPLASEQLRSIWGWDSINAGLNSVASGDPRSVASINTANKIQASTLRTYP
jgi:hypothetical protein